MDRSSSECRAIEGKYQRSCKKLQEQIKIIAGISSTFGTYIKDLLSVVEKGDDISESDHFEIITDLIENLRPCAQFRQEYFDKCVFTGQDHQMTESDLSHEHARLELKRVYGLFRGKVYEYRDRISLARGVIAREKLEQESEDFLSNRFSNLEVEDEPDDHDMFEFEIKPTSEEHLPKSKGKKGKGKKGKGMKGKGKLPPKKKNELSKIEQGLIEFENSLQMDREKRAQSIIFDIEAIDPFFISKVHKNTNGFYIEPFNDLYFQIDDLEKAVHHSKLITEIFVPFIQSYYLIKTNKSFQLSLKSLIRTLEKITKHESLLSLLRAPSMSYAVILLFIMSPTDMQIDNLEYAASIDPFFVYSSCIQKEPYISGNVDLTVSWIFKYARETETNEFRIRINNMINVFHEKVKSSEILTNEIAYDLVTDSIISIRNKDLNALSIVEFPIFPVSVECSETFKSEKYILPAMIIEGEIEVDGEKIMKKNIGISAIYEKLWEVSQVVHLPDYNMVRVLEYDENYSPAGAMVGSRQIISNFMIQSNRQRTSKNENGELNF